MLTQGARALAIRIACFLPLVAGLLISDWVSGLPPVRGAAMRNLNAAAAALVAGKAVSGADDPRDLRIAWLLNLPSAKDVLVLGSSRVMQISEQWFHPQTMFNAAVFSGGLDDAVSIVQFCLENGKLPRSVILELNPSLAPEGQRLPTGLTGPFLRRAFVRYRVFPERLLGGLFSLAGVRWDIRMMRAPAWGDASALTPGMYRVWPDGTIDWGPRPAQTSPDEAEAAAVWKMRHLDAETLLYRTSSQPKSGDLKILRHLLDDFQSRGIGVVVLLPPVHPAVYGAYYRQGGYHEDWIRSEMAGRGIRVVGSFSAAIAGASRADFLDDVHCRPSVLRRLLADAGIIQR
jgi:hypothetical protein